MKNETFKENLQVPRLRFPEFQNDPEWELKKLGEVVNNFSSNLALNKLELTNENDFPIYGANGIQGKINFYQYEKEYIAIVKDGAGVGRTFLCSPRSSILGTLTCLINKNENINLRYIYYLLNTIDFSNYIKGAGIPHIYFTDFKETLIHLPSLPEQQKIADCLSSLDEQITAEEKKLELYKQHKKGLLQKLFPKEGQSTPELRFPEFQNASEWEMKKLGEVYEFKTTYSIPRIFFADKGIIKIIHYGDIHKKFRVLFNIYKEEVPFINNEYVIKTFKNDNFCKECDIVIADTSEDLVDIGKCIEIVALSTEKVLAGLHTILARQKNKILVTGFGGYLFNSNFVKKQIQTVAQGTKVFSISALLISKIDIIFPQNKKEQKKIVSSLSSLDELIELQTKKIELLKQQKKGLLQQLFPSI